MNNTIRLIGDKELQRFFRRMPKNLNTKVLKKVERKAARPIVKEARRNTPVGPTGNLKRSLGVILPKRSGSREYTYVIVGARVKRGGRNQSGQHAHFVGHGTNSRVKKSGGSTGSMDGIGNWIGEAAGSVSGKSHAEMHKHIRPIIEKEMSKLK